MLFISLGMVFCLSCEEKKEITIYNFTSIEPVLYSQTPSIKIVNFWAMWCAPCIKELPYLEEYAATHPEVELVLVSLDFPEDIETKLKPFIKKKNIQSKVILLDAPDANSWIDKVNPSWSGAIPFTIISTDTDRSYHERSFESVEDLSNEVNKLQLN